MKRSKNQINRIGKINIGKSAMRKQMKIILRLQ